MGEINAKITVENSGDREYFERGDRPERRRAPREDRDRRTGDRDLRRTVVQHRLHGWSTGKQGADRSGRAPDAGPDPGLHAPTAGAAGSRTAANRGAIAEKGRTTRAEAMRIERTGEYPIELVRTSLRRHITGTSALNIPERRINTGDWHELSTWFADRPGRVEEWQLTNEKGDRRLLDHLGQWGIRDARPGLARLQHPGAKEDRVVWAASHDRAVIEESWRRLSEVEGPGARPAPFDQHELQKMLGYPDQWIRVRWWAWRLRGVMTASERELWDSWREEWWPWDRNARSTRRSA